MNQTRKEHDSIGSLNVPADAYYGVQSMRAEENFDMTHRRLIPEFIISLAQIKKAAAITNRNAGRLNITAAAAIIHACDDIIGGQLHDQFIVDPIQGGAGTSCNMNANEVIANRALEILGHVKGDYSVIHPNDTVNMSQSTNDVFPTAGKLTTLKLLPQAVKQLHRLADALDEKADEFRDVLKMGRTQLQDAVPTSLGNSFHAYASVVRRDIDRLTRAQDELRTVNLGGTAIGTGINACAYYRSHIAANLSSVTGIEFRPADDLIDATQNLDGFVAVSGVVRTCAVDLSKMSNDLRLLSSGPRTGIGEINLPARQNGSSIMPGKVNPVIPEVVTQAAFRIMGNDTTISLAAEAGQLELNAFEPVLFDALFESVDLLAQAVRTLVDHCITGLTANREHCRDLLNRSTGTATALCPYIGYEKSAKIAKLSLSTGKTVKELVLENHLLPEAQIDEVLDPARLAVSPSSPIRTEKAG